MTAKPDLVLCHDTVIDPNGYRVTVLGTVTLTPTPPAEDRLTLWAHLVAKHAGCYSLHLTLEELIDIHDHEHNGPGGIRNHDPKSREATLYRIGEILSESEPDDEQAGPDNSGGNW